MLPAAQVGGDYYDVIAREGGCWIGIGDVAGHGLQTGLVMLMIQSMVAGITGFDPSAQPSTVVRALNAALYENVRQRLYQDEHATFTLLRYEGGGHITFAGGHEDIIVYRASEDSVELVPMVGPWVGARALVHGIVDSQLKLGPGDVMVLFTDGVTEARNPSFEMFGLDRLQQLVRELGREPVETIRDRLLAAVLGWAPVLEDDATLVVMRHSPQVVHGRSGPA
jgi:serine phosphatase RsbU (regulator of sigma subunit)